MKSYIRISIHGYWVWSCFLSVYTEWMVRNVFLEAKNFRLTYNVWTWLILLQLEQGLFVWYPVSSLAAFWVTVLPNDQAISFVILSLIFSLVLTPSLNVWFWSWFFFILIVQLVRSKVQHRFMFHFHCFLIFIYFSILLPRRTQWPQSRLSAHSYISFCLYIRFVQQCIFPCLFYVINTASRLWTFIWCRRAVGLQ